MHTAVWCRKRMTRSRTIFHSAGTLLKTHCSATSCTNDQDRHVWRPFSASSACVRTEMSLPVAGCCQGIWNLVCTHRWSGVSLVVLFTLRSLTLNRCLMLKAICRLTLVPSRKAERFVARAQLSSPSRVPVWRGSWNLWCLSATHGRSAKVWRR